MPATQTSSNSQVRRPGFEAYQTTGQEDSDIQVMARIVGYAGTYITQALTSSIVYSTFDLSSATPTTAIVDSTSLTVSAVVFDALQRDERWTVDDIGYNFRVHTLAATIPATGDHMYRIEFKFTDSSSDVFFGVVQVYAEPISTS